MNVIKNVCLGVAFLLELGVLASVAYWGLRLNANLGVRLLAGIGGPILFIVVWALFGAPRAAMSAHGLGRVVLEIAWFGGGAAALWSAGAATPAIVFAAVYLVNTGLLKLWLDR